MKGPSSRATASMGTSSRTTATRTPRWRSVKSRSIAAGPQGSSTTSRTEGTVTACQPIDVPLVTSRPLHEPIAQSHESACDRVGDERAQPLGCPPTLLYEERVDLG